MIISFMRKNRYTIITGSGSYIPPRCIPNSYFLRHTFYDDNGRLLNQPNEEIIRKFSEITGIQERRYVTDDQVASDIGALAAEEALRTADLNRETLDYIIVAHNFGDVRTDTRTCDFLPTLASRIKKKLNIENPDTVCYDLPFGCAGWLQGVIQADFFIRSGTARRILVVGTDTLSRVYDPHDRDCMIYADGAGAVVLEAIENRKPVGILVHKTQTFAGAGTYVLKMGPSYNPALPPDALFMKMKGRVLYEHVLQTVPRVVKTCMEQAGVSRDELDMVLMHQANLKMDEAILKRIFERNGTHFLPEKMMPLTISFLGNSSVATVLTLYDLVAKKQMGDYTFRPGGLLLFAAMGAGVNINAMVYRVP